MADDTLAIDTDDPAVGEIGEAVDLPVAPEAAAASTHEQHRQVLPWALVAVLAVVALTTSVLAAQTSSHKRRDEADRRNVSDTAGRLATALSTYDYRSFDATKGRVLSVSTGRFADEYNRAVGALSSVIAETKAVSEATVTDVYVSDIHRGSAKAIVVVEIRATGVSGPRLSIDNYVDLNLVKVEVFRPLILAVVRKLPPSEQRLFLRSL